MSMTLKEILDQVFGESGFELPDVYVNNANPNVAQAVYIAKRSVEILKDFPLQRIGTDVATFSTKLDASTVPFTAALPTDFHSYVPDTAMLDGTAIIINLPASPDEWAWIKARGGNFGGIIYARFLNGQVTVLNPVDGATLTFEYLQNGQVRDGVTNALKANFVSDTDKWDRDDTLICLDVKWRFKREKGLDWEGDLQMFKQYANVLRARDRGAQTIVGGRPAPVLCEPYTNLWVT